MKPIILAILDGWGIAAPSQNNAISQAEIPNLKYVEKNYPSCSLQASGIAVGLPWNETGNSEVGHLNIGSGRVIYQYLPRISMEIKNGQFFNKPSFIRIIHHVRKNKSTLHLIGLISSGNVHSYLEHVYALLELARRSRIKNLCLHLFTDGKDAPLKEGIKIIAGLQEKIKEPNWKIGTVVGRFYAMDRNKNWDRTEKAYNLLTQGKGEKTQDPIKKIQEFYNKDINDTYMEPIVVVDQNKEPVGLIKDNDGIICFNFREDSVRQITKKLISGEIKNILFCAMTEYKKGLPVEIAYPPIEIKNHLTEILSQEKKKVLKIAETEKYAHVTYFFNGGKEKPYPDEDRKVVSSEIISHYEKNPEMQAGKITQAVLEGIKNKYDLIVVNYANPDMIGHTGDFQAGVKAVESIDKNIKPLVDSAEKGESILLITSDHGNIEEMISAHTGEESTKHSLNPVPFYLVGKEYKSSSGKATEDKEKQWGDPCGMLSDIAPTILDLMKIKKPVEITGQSLLKVLK